MKYSKCDFCSYNDHGKCLFPSYFRNPHNPGAENEKSPCDTAIGRMMQIMMCEMQNNKRQVEVNKNIRYNNKSRRR